MPKICVICTGGTFASVHSPLGYVAEKGVITRLRMFKSLYDQEFSELYGVADDECITPVTPFHKRILWKFHEFEVFLDSSNMNIDD